MTPERWQQTKHLCELALEREPAARAAFLEQVCAADGELRAQVESLLQYATVDDGGVDTRIWARLAPVPSVPPVAGGPHLPPQIGRYRIIRILGQAGRGPGYEAEQDSPLRRA